MSEREHAYLPLGHLLLIFDLREHVHAPPPLASASSCEALPLSLLQHQGCEYYYSVMLNQTPV
jgi:hypothetical protein